jgi:competence protein ComEA
MTVLQSLAIKLLMLAITAGVLYWALGTEPPEPERIAQSSVGPETTDRSKVELPAADNSGLKTGRKDPVLTPTQNPSAPALRTKSTVIAPARRSVTFPIDLNTAGREQLLELPGIGDKLAERILAYRKSHGAFRNVEELRKVKGIGKKRMEQVRPLVTAAHD